MEEGQKALVALGFRPRASNREGFALPGQTLSVYSDNAIFIQQPIPGPHIFQCSDFSEKTFPTGLSSIQLIF
jgi:hypothetical protein